MYSVLSAGYTDVRQRFAIAMAISALVLQDSLCFHMRLRNISLDIVVFQYTYTMIHTKFEHKGIWT